jgi:hypothetical protein
VQTSHRDPVKRGAIRSRRPRDGLSLAHYVMQFFTFEPDHGLHVVAVDRVVPSHRNTDRAVCKLDKIPAR